jgi:hypothetical protein
MMRKIGLGVFMDYEGIAYPTIVAPLYIIMGIESSYSHLLVSYSNRYKLNLTEEDSVCPVFTWLKLPL